MILYGTSACHLCELAEQLLSEMLADGRIREAIELIDIADSEQLVERFGVRIPVLTSDAGDKELEWPFDQRQVMQWQADHG